MDTTIFEDGVQGNVDISHRTKHLFLRPKARPREMVRTAFLPRAADSASLPRPSRENEGGAALLDTALHPHNISLINLQRRFVALSGFSNAS